MISEGEEFFISIPLKRMKTSGIICGYGDGPRVSDGCGQTNESLHEGNSFL